MPQERYGMLFDYDQRDGNYLVVTLDPTQSKRLVPHQLKMLLNNHIPQLLNVELENNNEIYRLQYDLTSKRRLFHVLQASPPSLQMFYEIAFRLVQTISNSSMYMLNEEQYILHNDFIYCGKDAADIYVCYLPLPTSYQVSIEDQLRLLLLRVLASVHTLDGDQVGLIKVMKVLQDENYLIPDLKQTLWDIWMKEATSSDRSLTQLQDSSTNVKPQTKPIHDIWTRARALFNLARKQTPKQQTDKSKNRKQQLNNKLLEEKPVSGVTEVLVKKQETDHNDSYIVINSQGLEEVCLLLEDRFIIGRNQSGVHYTDMTEGISRVHCEFIKSSEIIEVRDLGSLNGSLLNGERLVPYKSYPFKFGDVLKIVTTEIRLGS